jgi:aminoglycoside phosphotransferase (APT) family kinase protein
MSQAAATPGVGSQTNSARSLDFHRLSAWMDEQGLRHGQILDIEPLTGGTQNILIRFSRGGQRFVLRHPPHHKRKNSDETMRREATVLAALAGTDVPHPALIAACNDIEVLGSAFYLMEEVIGSNPRYNMPEVYDDHRWRFELGLALVDGAAAIAAVDYVAAGLAELGRPEAFLERQVARWATQLNSYSDFDGYPGPAIPGVDDVASWLDTNRPQAWVPGLMHGDYHLGNVLCRFDRPALAAVVDWELATIGDPLLDLGWLLATWPDGDNSSPVENVVWEGFPTAAELVARYAQRSDRDLSAIAWYEVLACYKTGIILEGTHARACAGLAPKELGDRLHGVTLRLFARARARIASA